LNFNSHGYIYNLPTFQIFNQNNKELFENQIDDYMFLNLTRIRIRPELKFNEDSRITMHYEANMLFSDIQSLLLITDKTNRQALDLNWKLFDENNIYAIHFIDRFYYKQNFNFGEFTIGRQRISWGVGRIWQPTDLFNPINPANFSQFEKPGADAFSAKYYFGLFTDLELVINYTDSWQESNFGGRLRTNFNEFDLSIMSGRFDNNYLAGIDFAGNLKGAGVRGEAIYNFTKNDYREQFIRMIFGLDYQFNEKLYGLVEYQFNGEGKTDKNQYELLRLFSGEILNLNQNYIAIQSTYQLHPLWNVNLFYNANLNDRSGFINGSISYNFLQNFNINFSSIYFYGEKDTEYSFYPSAIFINLEYYF
jgi:hypothetical protein